MLFECSTLLEDKVNMDPASSAKIRDPEHIMSIIDVAIRLALTDLPPRALSGIKVIERSSFKHLDDICPALWSPGHIEVSRITTLPVSCICTDNAFNRLLLHEQSSYLLSATPFLTLLHSEHSPSR